MQDDMQQELPNQQERPGKRILQSIHLSDFQGKVMLLIKTAPTPESAKEILAQQDPKTSGNLVGARDNMEKLGMIEITDTTATITPKGEEVMRDEYLIDEMGEPTEKGQQLLAPNKKEIPPQSSPPSDAPNGPGPGPGAFASGDETETSAGGGLPEHSIFRQVHDLSKLLKS